MSRKHALLAASSSSRWLNCTPSAVLESKIKSTTSSYADEGTLAHALAEIMLKQYFNLISQLDFNTELKDIEASEYYDNSMFEYISEYVSFVVEHYNSYDYAVVTLEQKLDMTEWVPDGFGHLDVSIVAGGILEVIDLKYGKGVSVSAVENKQLMLYALASVKEHEFIGEVETVIITIYQPRIDNYSSWTISVKELKHWAETELKPKAKLAYEGKGELCAGDWCKFCKVKPRCRAFTTAQLELAKLEFAEVMNDDYDFVQETVDQGAQFLTDKEISRILQKAHMFKNWISSVEEYALSKAIHENKRWPGLKLVRGRSLRKYTDEEKITELLTKKGFDEDKIISKKLKAIGYLEKYLGKAKFSEIVGRYIIKPQGALALVNENDKRPEHNSVESAQNDFENI